MNSESPLHCEFEIEVVRHFSYAQLFKYIPQLEEALSELRDLKEQAVMVMADVKAVELQGFIYNLEHNLKVMKIVLLEKEEMVTMPEADICPVFLN
jgi:hypothetical protein